MTTLTVMRTAKPEQAERPRLNLKRLGAPSKSEIKEREQDDYVAMKRKVKGPGAEGTRTTKKGLRKKKINERRV